MAVIPRVVVVCAIVGCILAARATHGQARHKIGPTCVGCICEASLCNGTATCHTTFNEDYWCGPFLLSQAYWRDAGRPVILNDNPERKGAFHSCVNDFYCGADTVRRYMELFANKPEVDPDCNGDGVVDCIDFGSIHFYGPWSCGNPGFNQTPFYKLFQPCLNKVTARGWL